MVYVEYNNSKKIKIENEINYEVSSSFNNYELLAFSPASSYYPSADLVADGKVIEDKDYLLNFHAIKTYSKGNYCFEYNGEYYLFNSEIKRNDVIYFKLVDNEYKLISESYTNNKIILPVFDELQLNTSGNETSFSEVNADFGNRTITELPMAYQEIRIWDGELIGEDDLSQCELLFTGYLDRATVTQKHREQDECDVQFSLLSPMNLATKRYVTINGTYNSYDLFNRIFSPLIADGFEIGNIDINDTDINVKYYVETIETVMNDLSNKLNIFWTIDKDKKIYITDINKLFNKDPILNITGTLEGLYKLVPVIENTNYFNTINIKNARVYSSEVDYYVDEKKDILDIMKLIQDESLEFINPVDFGIEGAERVCKNNNTTSCTILKITSIGGVVLYDIKYQNGDIVLPSGVVFSDEDTEGADLILQRDSFFKNLVTGITWKRSSLNLSFIESDTVLKYQIFKYYNSNEIYKCSDYITDSGIIEQTIDVNEAWFTYNEMVDYCSNLIIANSNVAGSVELGFDENYNISIGDKIRINKPEFFINGDFIVTEINEAITGNDSYECEIKAQNNQLQYNYIDIFRKQLTEDEEEKYSNINIINYVDDKITERHIQMEV